MKRFIIEQNLKLFREQLKSRPSAQQSSILGRLISEAEEELRNLEMSDAEGRQRSNRIPPDQNTLEYI